MDTRSLPPWLVVCTALALAHCGGAVTTATPDAAADGTAPHDGAADGFASSDAGIDSSVGCGFSCDAGMDALPLCPVTPPTPGTPCTASQVCEYGSSWWLNCNFVMQCLATGQGGSAWSLEFDGGGCPWLDAGGPCPATWAEASGVDAQVMSCPFVTCVYPEGFCGCGIGCGGGGGLPRPQDVTGFFTCIPAAAGCPEPRPLSGTACDSGAFCNYGFACGCGQFEQCTDGMWQATRAPPCP